MSGAPATGTGARLEALDPSMAVTEERIRPLDESGDLPAGMRAVRSGPAETAARGVEGGAGIGPSTGDLDFGRGMGRPSARVELPPESSRFPTADISDADDPAEQFRAGIQRRNRFALLAVLGIAVIAGLGLGARAVLNRKPAIPPQALEQNSRALAALRTDDPKSQQDAIDSLAQVIAANPTFLEARSNRVLALAMRLDDSRISLRHIQAQSEELNRKIARLQETKTPSDWNNRVNAMIEQLQKLQRQSEPLIDQSSKVDEELNQGYTALQGLVKEPSPEEERAYLRAQAAYLAIKGQDPGQKLARYQAVGGTDGWEVIIPAEFALNAKVPPETESQTLAGLEKLRQADRAFLRAPVLVARLSLKAKRFDEALAALEDVIALNRGHETARVLLAQSKDEQRSVGEKSPLPPPP